MKKDVDGILAIIGKSAPKEDKGEEETLLLEAFSEFKKAMRSGDDAAGARALKTFIEACSNSYPEDESEE